MQLYEEIKINFRLVLLAGGVLVLSTLVGCKKLYSNLPDNKDFISEKMKYNTKIFEPVLGRTTLMGSVSLDNSTLPIKFEIVNPRYGDGRPVTDFLQTRPTWVWTAEYDGYEKSLAEIEAKRKIVEKPLFEVRESGQFIMWASSTNDLIAPRPADSSSLTQDIRFFDLKVTNTGGSIVIPDFQLIPWRERPYEPSTDINPYTGAVKRDPNDPTNPKKQDFITPTFTNVIGMNNKPLVNNSNQKDFVVYIRPFKGGTGKNLRFVFLDKESKPINPSRFNETKWDQLVHGFNMVKTDEYVQYDVAYPIPLVNINTPYTTGGEAKIDFSYSRLGFGGFLNTATFGLKFKIFRPGDWEIVFHFKNENPKFEDE